MYVFTLSDGRKLYDVRQNGGMFSTNEAITREELDAGLGRVVISGSPDDAEHDNDYSGEHTGLRTGYYAVRPGGGCEFALQTMSEMERLAMEFRANVEYLAMMTGVEI